MFKNLYLLTLFIFVAHFTVNGQSKRPLEHEDTYKWESINSQQISNDGNWIVYTTNPFEGNQTLYIYNTQSKKTTTLERSQGPKISSDNKYLAFTIKPDVELVKELK
ncbi:MAG: hypothetical protein AAFO07_23340, partial [Bacteroidota bacterium]